MMGGRRRPFRFRTSSLSRARASSFCTRFTRNIHTHKPISHLPYIRASTLSARSRVLDSSTPKKTKAMALSMKTSPVRATARPARVPLRVTRRVVVTRAQQSSQLGDSPLDKVRERA